MSADDQHNPDQPRARPPRSLLVAKVLALVLAFVGIALAWRSGIFAELSEPRQLAESLVESGVWGYAAFVLAYALLQPFGVPGTVFIVAAPLIWSWPVAFALSMVGTMAASVIGFSFARFVARDWVAARIPKRFRRYDAALEAHAFQTVFLLRLIFWMPQLLHAFFGVSRVPFWTHFWGSVVGYVPPLLVVSVLGAEIFNDAGQMQPRALVILGALAAASLLLAVLLRRRARRARPAATPEA